ncbi:MAG: LysM peptidoglycan-binding domain-containing protein [Treponema sp.]|nr:LysM peptidoglycan-binding domain-containing protein [Treponema sp.]
MQAVYIFWGIVCFLVPVSSYARDVIYTVRNGDTLFSLSRAFMVQSEELMARNGISDPQKLRVGQQLIIPSAQNHPVVWGDTLSGIAFKYDIPEQVLREANKLSANYVLKVGDTLTIPRQAPRTEPIEQAGGLSAALNRHTVVRGETLYGIARTYSIPEQVLREANKLSANYVLKVGDILTIPGQAPRTEPIEQTARTSSQREHTVVRGETILGIALAYGIPEQALRSANKLSANYVLKVGDTLTIPQQSYSTPVSQQARPSNVSARNQQWPVSAREIRSVSGKISGVLLSGDRGETVYAIRAGTVISAGPYSGYGKVVIIDSPNGYTYTYACLDVLTVKVGDTVTPGLSLGTLGQQRLLFLVYDAHGTAVDPATAPRG